MSLSGTPQRLWVRMKYICLIYVPADRQDEPEKDAALASEFAAFTNSMTERGLRVSSGRLGDTELATTVRLRDGRRLISDGPFAEGKEVLGGFYILECADLDEALSCASMIPIATYGTVEVRPIAVF
jgi:hypothetical protein